MKALIVTGMSGAGKSMAIRQLEDMGFFCVDNLPPSLIPTFSELCRRSGDRMARIALVTDIRGGMLLNELLPSLESLQSSGVSTTVIFLDASDAALVKRFKETRRSHPLAPQGRVLSGIEAERLALEPIRKRADCIIDTSNLSSGSLRAEIERIAGGEAIYKGLAVNFVSFGFKYGLPLDCDLAFDVRFTPNPFYVPSLKRLTGKDHRVSEYVFSFAETTAFVDKAVDMLLFLIPYYRREGKSQIMVGIGCTGGKHRSVAVACELSKRLTGAGHKAAVEHRDIDKDSGREKQGGLGLSELRR